MKNQKLILALVVLFIVTAVVIFFARTPAKLNTDKKIKVAASFYPLAHFTEKVGGEKVEVINLTPSGVEPHEYEPSAKDIQQVYATRLFVYNGAGFDPWADKINADLKQKKIAVIRMSDNFELIKPADQAGHEEKMTYDPHLWVDPNNAVKEVDLITQALVKIDPENKEVYLRNSSAYLLELKNLVGRFDQELKSCQSNKIVVSHNAFSYLTKRYNLTVESIAGISTEEEPSPKQLVAITKFVQENEIKYIFFETLISPKLSETIAQEAGAQTLVLNPVEDGSKGSYLEIMGNNLNNLKTALNCK